MDLFVEYKQVLYAFAAVAVVVALGWLRSQKYVRLPPGPRGWPIVGNLFDMGTHPHKTLAKMAKMYGSLMYLRLGQKGCIIASSPAMAKEFLKNQDANFADRPHLVQGDILFYNRQGTKKII
jgi:flavonoid 3',5'-hydroxylase